MEDPNPPIPGTSQQVTGSKKRARSPEASGSDDARMTKARKVAEPSDIEKSIPPTAEGGQTEPPPYELERPSLKRARAESADLDDDVDLPNAKSTRLEGPDSDEPSTPPPPYSFLPPSLPVSVELGGVTVTNLHMVSVDEDGDEIRVTAPVVPVEKGASLLSPESTPSVNSDLHDPSEDHSGHSTEECKQHKFVAYAHDSPAKIAIAGDAMLFGFIPAQVLAYDHTSSSVHPYVDIMRLKTDDVDGLFSLGNIFTSLKDSPLDAIALKNPEFGYQAQRFQGHADWRMAGMYFDTQIVFQGPLSPVSDFLRDFFNQEDPGIRFSAWLGPERRYDKFHLPSSITFQGTLEHISVKVLDLLEFTRIGIELFGTQVWSVKEDRTVWRLGYAFFGNLNLAVPGTAIPLRVEYRLQKLAGTWQLNLSLRNDEWTDIFGIKGVSLREVTLSARLAKGKPGSTNLSFNIRAIMQLRNAHLEVSGCYGKDNYSIEATLGNLSLQDVGEIFHELLGIHLDIFDHDVVFNYMSLRICSEGVSLSGQVTINGHTSARARLAFTKDGIAISGGIGGLEFEIAEGTRLEILNAGFDVFVASKLDTQCARASKVAIMGDVCYDGIEVKIGLYTEKSARGEVLWAAYGEVEGDISTAKLAPAFKDTFLDIELRRLTLVAGNHSAPCGKYPGLVYPVAKGFQFCAAIDGIHELEQLMRGSVRGMVLKAAYTNGKAELSIDLPAERTISFGDSVYSGPLSIALQIDGADTQLVLRSILNLKVETQPDPLQFDMGLKASTEAAGVYAQMLNDWMNPCNIGQSVVIRNCTLEFGIVYKTFVATGTPGVIGLAGELQIGSKRAGVAMKVSQSKDQLLAASIQDLGVADLVQFASLIVGEKLPPPDADMLHFTNLDLYLSTGTTLGTKYYAPGASFEGKMMLFGKKLEFNASVGSEGIKLFATMEEFKIGPLTVSGAKQADPVVDLEVSKSTQKVFIDGAVKIWGASAAVHLNVVMLPSPKLDFAVDLRLSDLIMLKLEANLSGQISFKDMKSWATADFEVHGLMEQHLIEYVTKQLEGQIDAAREAAKHGFDSMKKSLEEKEEAFKASCQAAIDMLEEKRKVWHEKEKSIREAFHLTEQQAERLRNELQAKVDQAEQIWKALVSDLKAVLQATRSEANAAIWAAECKVNDAQRDSDEAISWAQGELQRVRQDFENGFGSARRDLESARRDVEDAQRRVDDLDRDIDEVNRAIDREPWYRCPPLVAEKATLLGAQAGATAGLQLARGILIGAEALVRGTGFVTAEGLIRTAELGLDEVRELKTKALNLANDALEEIRDGQNKLIWEAEEVIRKAETLSEERHLFDKAKELLDEGCRQSQLVISGAKSAVDGLAKATEFIAFSAAEGALRFAQENTAELNLARHAVEAAEGTVNFGLDLGKWAVSHAGKLFDIRELEFRGSVASLLRHEEGKSGPAMMVHIDGIVMGKEIAIHIEWEPHFNLVELIKELFARIWAKIKELAAEGLKLLKEI